MQCLNAYCRWLHLEHGHDLVRVPLLKTESKVLRTFGDSELRLLLSFKPRRFYEWRTFALVFTLGDTGCRIDELLRLRLANVDLDWLLLTVRGKGGVPLAIRLTAANRDDSQEALALVDAIPPLQGGRGRPRRRPACVLGDRGYDAASIRSGLRARHILPLLAMRRTTNGSGLGRWRWVVERTFAWLNQFRRLRVRYDKRADIHGIPLAWLCMDLLAVAAEGSMMARD